MVRRALTDERGFTLLELLVVILIIGVLAAIALPLFLAQSAKARDATAKADVRNAVTQVEGCYAEPSSYGACPGPDHPLAAGVGLTTTGGGTGFTVSQLSASGTTFTIDQQPSGATRSCTPPGVGGCRSDGSW